MQDSTEHNGYKHHFADFTDASLDVFLKSGHPNVLMITAAAEEFYRRKREREDVLHSQLLTEIRKPHWSVTPGFLVGVVAMIAACIAAYPVLFPQPQTPQPAVVVSPFVQTNPPASNMPSGSLQQLSIPPAAQAGTAKR